MRTIEAIAREIRQKWQAPSPYALPYLNYMLNPWGVDSPRTAALYFLSNAGGWRGPEAKRLKDELRRVVA